MKSPRVVILTGPPASGKTTAAMKLVKKGYVRLSKDWLRERLFEGRYNPDDVQMLEDVIITFYEHYLKRGRNIVSDMINIPSRFLDLQVSLAKKYGAKVEIRELKTPVEECVSRDRRRANPCGAITIRLLDRCVRKECSPCSECRSPDISVLRYRATGLDFFMGEPSKFLWVCARCGHRWPVSEREIAEASEEGIHRLDDFSNAYASVGARGVGRRRGDAGVRVSVCNEVYIPENVCYIDFRKRKVKGQIRSARPLNDDDGSRTIRNESVIIDYDRKGRVVGIELLDPHAAEGKKCKKVCQRGGGVATVYGDKRK